MQGQGGLVREDPGAVGPQPEGHQVLVLTGREVLEAINAAAHASEAAVMEILGDELRRVPGVRCLGGRRPALPEMRPSGRACPSSGF